MGHASLEDLMNFAQYSSSIENPLPGFLNSAVGGFEQGQAQGAARAKAKLDRSLKMLDIQEKIQKIQKEQLDYTMSQNMAKAAGLWPGDPADDAAVRQTAGTVMGKQPDPLLSAPSTPAGKLRAMWDSAELDSKGGVKFKFKNPQAAKTKEPITPFQKFEMDRAGKKDDEDAVEDIMKIAQKSAVQKIANNDQDDRALKYKLGAIKEIIPRTDEIQAQMPGAYRFRKGSMDGYDEFYKRASGLGAEPPKPEDPTAGIGVNEKDPWNLLGQ